jgi:DNA-binding MarR family transcriptional regulator
VAADRRRIPQLELDHQLCFSLARASRAVVRSYGPHLGRIGLTYPQYLVMLVLWETGEPTGVGAIGDRLHLDTSTLTPLLKRLEQAGLVDRSRDPADERRVTVTLTDQGTALRERAAAIPAAVFGGYGMTLDDGARLKAQLDDLALRVEASIDDA